MAFNLFQNQPIASKSVLPNFAEAYNKPQSLAAKLLEAQLKNKHDSIINQYLPRSEDARINNILANFFASSCEFELNNKLFASYSST